MKNNLNKSQVERFSRQLVLKNIGAKGQKRIMSSKVLIVGLGIFYYVRSKDKYRLCKFLAIIYLVKLGFYKIYPKQPLMLYSLSNQKQVEAWADIYTEMKSKWIKSIAIGFAGYLLLGLNY